jgi:nucleoside-diphosphate-sugar epimerase
MSRLLSPRSNMRPTIFEPACSAAERSALPVQSDDGPTRPTSAGSASMSQNAGLSRHGDEIQYPDEERDVVRVFVAGGAGVIGRRLVPQLVARGHQVTATTTSEAKLRLLEQLGADGVVMDGLDAASVKEAVAAARPDAIVHEMTALSVAHNGKPNFRHPERLAATTNRLRSEGIDHLLAAAEATGVSHVVAQSVATWTEGPDGGRVSEEDQLPSEEVGPKMRGMVEALRRVEDVVGKAGGAALRYGAFYGPGANDDLLELVRKRRFPLVGDGTGYFNWVHLDDAASATVLALEQQAKGVFNIVDDEPAQVRDWLPYLAESAGLRRPMRLPKWLAQLLAGEMVKIVTQGRAFSNAKAKRELGWELRYPSWRQGFKEELG